LPTSASSACLSHQFTTRSPRPHDFSAARSAHASRHHACGRPRPRPPIRESSQVPARPLPLYNPILQWPRKILFRSAAASAGPDCVLVHDLTPENQKTIAASSPRIISTNRLSPALPLHRRAPPTIAAACSSVFLYMISPTGVTGAKEALPDDLPRSFRRTTQPSRQSPHSRWLWHLAAPAPFPFSWRAGDAGRRVGSALVSEIDKAKCSDGAFATALRTRALLSRMPPATVLSLREVIANYRVPSDLSLSCSGAACCATTRRTSRSSRQGLSSRPIRPIHFQSSLRVRSRRHGKELGHEPH